MVEFLALATETTAPESYFTNPKDHGPNNLGTNGSQIVANTNPPQTKRTWRVYGPDGNAGYGGMQGIGGLEAFIDESTLETTAVVLDYFANVVAWIHASDSGGETSLSWNETSYYGYGEIPASSTQDSEAVTEESTINSSLLTINYLSSLANWRSRGTDSTGFVYMGARYYDPTSGKFLSPDPAGHAASMSLYDYANGDPVNFVDPDGRIFGFFKSLFKKIVNFAKKIIKRVIKNVKRIVRSAYKTFKDPFRHINKAWSWFKKEVLTNPYLTAIVGIAIAVFVPFALAAIAPGFAGTATVSILGTSLTVGNFGAVVVAGALSGFITSGGNLRGALIGAVTAAAFYGAGQLSNIAGGVKDGVINNFVAYASTKILAHGVIGGVTSVAYGGDFLSGFASGAIAAGVAVAGNAIPGNNIGDGNLSFKELAIASVGGGVAAELTGGDFQMGAVTGAFSYLFNQVATGNDNKKDTPKTPKTTEKIVKGNGDHGKNYTSKVIGVNKTLQTDFHFDKNATNVLFIQNEVIGQSRSILLQVGALSSGRKVYTGFYKIDTLEVRTSTSIGFNLEKGFFIDKNVSIHQITSYERVKVMVSDSYFSNGSIPTPFNSTFDRNIHNRLHVPNETFIRADTYSGLLYPGLVTPGEDGVSFH